MTIKNMAETVLRTNTVQNVVSPLTPTTSGSVTVAPATRLEQLKQRKLDLDKILNEKINLLHRLCRQEQQLGIEKVNIELQPTGVYDENLNYSKDGTLKDLVPPRISPHQHDTDQLLKIAIPPIVQQSSGLNRNQKQNYDIHNCKPTSETVNVSKKRLNYNVSNVEYNNNKGSHSPIYPTSLNTLAVPVERRNSLLLANSTHSPSGINTNKGQSVYEPDYNPDVQKFSSGGTISYHYHHSHYYNNSRETNVSNHSHYPNVPRKRQDTDQQFDFDVILDNYHQTQAINSPTLSINNNNFGHGNETGTEYNRGLLSVNYPTTQSDHFYHQMPTMPTIPSVPTQIGKIKENEFLYVPPRHNTYQPIPTTVHQHKPTNNSALPQERQPQGLGGYWVTLENNERVWCTVENRFQSLDRKNQQKIFQKPQTNDIQHSSKSISLGNIDILTKHDKYAPDSLSISSANMETKTSKEKQWIETPLDGPVIRYKNSPNILQYNPQSINYTFENIHSPPIQSQFVPNTTGVFYKEKKKLSSHSMHSPNSNSTVEKRSVSVSQVPYSNLDKALSSSIFTLTSSVDYQQNADNTFQTDNYATESYQHILLSPVTNSPTHLRRTASSVSTSNNPAINSPSDYPFNATSRTFDIRTESPKNMTVIQQAKFQPYKEVTKPFEMSDFYKYSTKFRQKMSSGSMMGGDLDGNCNGT